MVRRLMTEPITIEDYDPRWPEHFQILRMRIAAALDGLTNAIEHVGSTAVLRLAAKPIIDIDVLLRSTADLPLVISRLVALGYGHQGDLGITGREAFLAPRAFFRITSRFARRTAGSSRATSCSGTTSERILRMPKPMPSSSQIWPVGSPPIARLTHRPRAFF